MTRKGKTFFLIMGIILFSLGTAEREELISAVKTKSDFQILKQALEKPGTGVIGLKRSIRMTGPIYVKGEKVLVGNGHLLERESGKGRVYGGSLFIVQNASLTIQDAVVSGGGAKKTLRGSVFGRLIDVGQGKLVLEKKSVLRDNRNTERATDGGGAVKVLKNGSFEMRGGQISGNKNVTGGAGICIEAGGKAVITGGTVSQNQVQGMGKVEGFDGRGGAISNRGNLKIEGGNFTENRAVSYAGKQADYGGVGGMLYNEGTCRITGGTISGNRASTRDAGIYTAKGANFKISGGNILNPVYLQEGAVLQVTGGLSPKQKIILEPQRYQSGRYLVIKGKKSAFQLKENKGFSLQENQKGLYIAKVEKRKKTEEQKKSAERQKTKEQGSKKQRNLVLPHKAPKIKTAPRYLFEWEVKNYTEKKWREVLLSGIRVEDDTDSVDKRKEAIQIQWNGLTANRAGRYEVTMDVKGRKNHVSISVTLVPGERTEENQEGGYVRFLPVNRGEKTAYEEWYFSGSDIQKAKAFMGQQENPFSAETNQSFYNQFSRCYIRKVGG
ncbi:MAG: hypothetical protein J1F22_04790 [Lachnospiraceae bacterium]|nr:hypothetical protein [Lachnospiraceae bacterium]